MRKTQMNCLKKALSFHNKNIRCWPWEKSQRPNFKIVHVESDTNTVQKIHASQNDS